jgi:hypothetical protein
LNEELQQAEVAYGPRFKEAEAIEDPVQRRIKVDGLQNSFSTKQSNIRKKYGVRLRNRRKKAEIELERQRMGVKRKHSVAQPESPPAKRHQASVTPPPQTGPQVVANNHHLDTPDSPPRYPLASGTLASIAAAATSTELASATITPRQEASPTPPPPQDSLSSYQRKGYRVSSHVRQPSQNSVAGGTAPQSPPNEKPDVPTQPVAVRRIQSESDTDTDSDADIPANLPPGPKITSV